MDEQVDGDEALRHLGSPAGDGLHDDFPTSSEEDNGSSSAGGQ